MNNISIVGRMGKDPEVRYLESGNSVATFSVAVRRRQKGEEITDWFNCEVWNKAAEIVQNYCHKGDLIAVQGRHVNDRWEKEGQPRDKWVLRVENVHLIQPKNSAPQAPVGMPQAPAPIQTQQNVTTATPVASASWNQTDVPF